MSSPPNIPDSSIPGQLAHVQPPESWIYDRDPANGIARATFNGEVYAQTINSPAAGVSAFNGRTGSVTLDLADVEAAGGAPLASPSFTGTPTAPTEASGTSNTTLATTAFVQQAVQQGAGVTTFNGRTGTVQLTLGDVTSVGGAPLASPALSGSPSAPTPVVTDNSSLLATTAYVNNWGAQNTVLSFNGRRGTVTLTLTDVESVGGAPIASPTFTGTPVVPTAAPGTATGQAASTAFVENAITAGVSGVASFNGRAGAVTLTTADVTGAGGAPALSPVLTGTPTAPTAVAGTNTGQIATTAFVETAIGSIAPIVNSFNGRNGTVTLTLGDVTGVGGAPIASPAFTGTPTVPTAAPGTNTTEAASCAFVEAAIASVAGVSSFNTRQGAVTLAGSDITGAGGALLASPAFTGTPTVPTATAGTATTQAASTAFVGAAVTAGTAGYLPLSGGTLTGGLGGTTASFSGALSAGGNISSSGGSLIAGGNVYVGGSGGPFLTETASCMTANFYGPGGHYIALTSGVGFSWVTAYSINIAGNDGIGLNGGGAGITCSSGGAPGNDDSQSWGVPGRAWFQVASYNFPNPSDPRLKDDMQPAPDGAAAIVNAVAVHTFCYKGHEEQQHYGFDAIEVREHHPTAIMEGEDEDKTLAVNLPDMIAMLWKAVQELSAEVEELKSHDRPIGLQSTEDRQSEAKETRRDVRHAPRARHH